MVWRDELTQVFFHVNTLMQHIDHSANKYRNLKGKIDPQEEEMISTLFNSLAPAQDSVAATKLPAEQVRQLVLLKVKRHVKNDNVAIIWNESPEAAPEKIFTNQEIEVFVIVTPLTTGFCSVKVVNVPFRLYIRRC